MGCRVFVVLVLLCAVYPVTPWRAIDGDTLEFSSAIVGRAVISPNVAIETTVLIARERLRLLGIDAPERGTSTAEEATKFLTSWMQNAQGPTVHACARDAFGRLLGDVTDTRGRGLTADLLGAGHARPVTR